MGGDIGINLMIIQRLLMLFVLDDFTEIFVGGKSK